MQRFGLPKYPAISHLIGKAILDNNINKFTNLYLKSGNNKFNYDDVTKCSNIIDLIDQNLYSFFQNAWYSYLWNKDISESIAKSSSNYNIIKNKLFKLSFPCLLTDYYNLINLNIPMKSVNKATSRLNNFKYINRQSVIFTYLFINEILYDDLFDNNYKLLVSFVLPSGCYATMFIKNFLYLLDVHGFI